MREGPLSEVSPPSRPLSPGGTTAFTAMPTRKPLTWRLTSRRSATTGPPTTEVGVAAAGGCPSGPERLLPPPATADQSTRGGSPPLQQAATRRMVWRWAAARAAGHRSTSASAAPRSLRKSHRQTAASARNGAAMLRWSQLPQQGTPARVRRGRRGGAGAGKDRGEAACAASAGCVAFAWQPPALPLSPTVFLHLPPHPPVSSDRAAHRCGGRLEQDAPTRRPPHPRPRPQAAARARWVAAPARCTHARVDWRRGRGVGRHAAGKRHSSATLRGGWRVAVTRSQCPAGEAGRVAGGGGTRRATRGGRVSAQEGGGGQEGWREGGSGRGGSPSCPRRVCVWRPTATTLGRHPQATCGRVPPGGAPAAAPAARSSVGVGGAGTRAERVVCAAR